MTRLFSRPWCVAYGGQEAIFACRPCFLRLEKGEKQIQALEDTVNEIASLAASARILMDAGTKSG